MIYLHGKPPYRAVFLHGGPGAPGSAAIAARELSKTQGILEPWQSAHSIAGLLKELEMQLGAASLPCSLLGHSWGAMQALLFAARHPSAVRQLLLISCPPLADGYSRQITDRRLKNLSAADAARFLELSSILSSPSQQNSDGLLSELGRLAEKADTVAPLPLQKPENTDAAAYASIWREAENLRKEGGFLQALKRISCPVFVLHGELDPHPLEGVLTPLQSTQIPYQLILFPSWGHTPFLDRDAAASFYRVVQKILAAAPAIP